MFDSVRPQHVAPLPAVVVGGGRPAAKVALGPGLTREMWDTAFGSYFDAGGSSSDFDAIFGPGSADAVAERGGVAISPARAYRVLGFFRQCAKVRARALASLPWAVYPEGAEPGDYEAALFTEQHPAPPPELAPLRGLRRTLHLTEASLALVARAYLLLLRDGPGTSRGRLKRFRGFQWLSPLSVEPKLGEGGVEGYWRTVNGRRVPLAAEAVLPIWEPDPFVELGPGSSDGASAGPNAAALHALARFLARHLDGGLLKMTVLAPEQGFASPSDQQASDMKRLWGRFLRRGADRDGPPVLRGLKPHVIGEGVKELSNADLTLEQRQAIASAFGVPWVLVMDDAANYATAVVHERGFLLRTVIPQAEVIEDALNTFLGQYGLSLRFEPERAEVMQQYELEKAAQVVAVCGGPVLTRNEGRQMLGREPLDEFEAGTDMDDVDGGEAEPEAPAGPAQRPAARPPMPSKSLDDRIAAIMGEL